MTQKSEANFKKVHFVGIGGIGVSSLARLFLAKKWIVTGSDSTSSSITKELKEDGIKVKIGAKASNVPKDATLVIHTVAVPTDHPELITARKNQIQILSYPEALGQFTKEYKTIAVSGCHGKSTTTALLASIFVKANLDPTVILGTKFFRGRNFRNGSSEYLIIEADEYKGAFWRYYPYAAIINNIELDHIDFYKNLGEVKKSFLKFTKNINPKGFIVLNDNDQNILDIKDKINLSKIFFSNKDIKIIEKIKSVIKIPGEHNVLNALAAYKLSTKMGIKEDVILDAIKSFKGVWRRSEYKGKSKEGWLVFDDYAHHPTAVETTLKGIKSSYPKYNVIAVFEPHQMLRFSAFYHEFKNSFHYADKVILVDVYNPKGRDEKNNPVNSKTLVTELNAQNQGVAKYSKINTLYKDITALTSKSKKNVIVFMSAGDLSSKIPKIISFKK